MVLVVDGEVLVRSEIAAYLRDCGYTVIEAATTDEAVTVLSEPAIAVASVLCDARVGGAMNGFSFAHWVRGLGRGLDVLLAGNLERATDAAADLCDGGPQLRRPYEPAAVADRIRRQLAERDRNGTG